VVRIDTEAVDQRLVVAERLLQLYLSVEKMSPNCNKVRAAQQQ
jgi:hypothetical protein